MKLDIDFYSNNLFDKQHKTIDYKQYKIINIRFVLIDCLADENAGFDFYDKRALKKRRRETVKTVSRRVFLHIRQRDTNFSLISFISYPSLVS